MKTKAFVLLTGLATLSWLLTRCVDASQNDNVATAIQSSAPSPSDSAALIARGEYLVTIMGCDDCHSPKQMGPQGPEIIPDLRLYSYPSERPVAEVDANALRQGGAFMNSDLTSATGPRGTSFAGNISSDATGIGQWTEAQFKKALTQGKYKELIFESKTKNGAGENDYTDWYAWYLEPRGNYIDKALVVLTDRYTISAGERAVMAFKTLPQVTFGGDTTSRAQGTMIGRELANGWFYSLVPQKTKLYDGKSYERIGLSHDLYVKNTLAELSFGKDAMLEAGMEVLK